MTAFRGIFIINTKLTKKKVYMMSNTMEFFQDGENKIKYCNKCLHCKNNCKQSYKATILVCPKYKDRQR